jgi:hypothetical protein
MGMFDGIICEYELPLPEKLGELSEIGWKELEFQTKSLNNTLSKYTIEEDGQIYEEKTKQRWVDDEAHENGGYIQITEDGIEKSYFTGELIFFSYLPCEKYDYFIEFMALFWKGELKEIKLEEWKQEENTQRIEEEKKFEEVRQRIEKQFKEQSLFKKIIKTCVHTVTYCIRWILGFLVKLTWKLDRWLT